MRMEKLAILIPLGMMQVSLPGRADEPTALEKLRSDAPAGKLKEVDLTATKIRIADPAPVSDDRERPVITPASLQQPAPAVGVLARDNLEAEVGARLRDLDACRPAAAASAAARRQESPADYMVLRWTIEDDGRTKNTLVYQEQPGGNIELMKCVRRRIEGWQFTPPVGGPVVVEQTYRAAVATPAVAEAAGTEPAAAPAQKKADEGK
jgi:hypothetical protein